MDIQANLTVKYAVLNCFTNLKQYAVINHILTVFRHAMWLLTLADMQPFMAAAALRCSVYYQYTAAASSSSSSSSSISSSSNTSETKI